MKIRAVTKIITAGAIALGATAIIQQPSSAQATGFKCETSRINGSPTVYAETPDGYKPIISFFRNDFPAWPPARRCGEVAKRFQYFAFDRHGNPTGDLRFLTVGYVNRQPAVCVAGHRGDYCNENTLLLTLKEGDDAAGIVQQLFDIGIGNRNTPIWHSGDNRPFLNFEDFLNSRPVENIGSVSSPSPDRGQQTQPRRPSSRPTGPIF